MPVVAFGLNHRSAPLAVLERVSLPSHRLAKVVRDVQEQKSFVSRIDEARREKLMAAHDPYRAQPL